MASFLSIDPRFGITANHEEGFEYLEQYYSQYQNHRLEAALSQYRTIFLPIIAATSLMAVMLNLTFLGISYFHLRPKKHDSPEGSGGLSPLNFGANGRSLSCDYQLSQVTLISKNICTSHVIAQTLISLSGIFHGLFWRLDYCWAYVFTVLWIAATDAIEFQHLLLGIVQYISIIRPFEARRKFLWCLPYKSYFIHILTIITWVCSIVYSSVGFFRSPCLEYDCTNCTRQQYGAIFSMFFIMTWDQNMIYIVVNGITHAILIYLLIRIFMEVRKFTQSRPNALPVIKSPSTLWYISSSKNRINGSVTPEIIINSNAYFQNQTSTSNPLAVESNASLCPEQSSQIKTLMCIPFAAETIQAAKTTVIILVSYLVYYIPHLITRIFYCREEKCFVPLNQMSPQDIYALFFVKCIASIMNGMLDPLILTYRFKQVNFAFRRFCRRCWPKSSSFTPVT